MFWTLWNHTLRVKSVYGETTVEPWDIECRADSHCRKAGCRVNTAVGGAAPSNFKPVLTYILYLLLHLPPHDFKFGKFIFFNRSRWLFLFSLFSLENKINVIAVLMIFIIKIHQWDFKIHRNTSEYVFCIKWKYRVNWKLG